jgi:peptidoglycan/LPS O-acetylase OafA/YrhL
MKNIFRSQALDGFRGLGCILVLLGHTHRHGVTILPGAVISMDLFFTLSGFLITGVLMSEWVATGAI